MPWTRLAGRSPRPALRPAAKFASATHLGWMFLFWLPDFNAEGPRHGLDLKNLGPPIVAIYLLSDRGGAWAAAPGLSSEGIIQMWLAITALRKTHADSAPTAGHAGGLRRASARYLWVAVGESSSWPTRRRTRAFLGPAFSTPCRANGVPEISPLASVVGNRREESARIRRRWR